MVEEIREKLFSKQDLEYRDLQTRICPGVDNIIGVRIPEVRKIAKEILKRNYLEYLEKNDDLYFEEIIIQGIIIASNKIELDLKFKYLRRWIPKIDNWAVCDVVSASFKIDDSNRSQIYDFITSYKNSNKEFELRFMLVMMLNYYLTDQYLDDIFSIITNIQVDYYYTNMASAWLLSKSYVVDRKRTLNYLKNSKLSQFVYLKSLQKIIESNKVSNVEKEEIRKLRKDFKK